MAGIRHQGVFQVSVLDPFSVAKRANFHESLVRDLRKQAGTGPSRRHIQGSKIAKRLPSVKYSLLQYSEIKFFFEKKIFEKITYSKKWTEWRAGAR